MVYQMAELLVTLKVDMKGTLVAAWMAVMKACLGADGLADKWDVLMVVPMAAKLVAQMAALLEIALAV